MKSEAISIDRYTSGQPEERFDFITIEARIPQLQSFTISSGMNCDTSLSAVDNQCMELPYPA